MSGFVWKVVYKIQYDATTMDDTIAGKSINQSFISKLCMQFSIMATTDSPPPPLLALTRGSQSSREFLHNVDTMCSFLILNGESLKSLHGGEPGLGVIPWPSRVDPLLQWATEDRAYAFLSLYPYTIPMYEKITPWCDPFIVKCYPECQTEREAGIYWH